MSASKLRLAASEGDFKSLEVFQTHLIIKRKWNFTILFARVWVLVKLGKLVKFDEETLRNRHIKEDIYSIGTVVENINTGLKGKVLRRGTNYVIAVTEGDVMFKSWLRDLIEHNDKPHEIATDEYREYLQGLTPGQKIARYNKTRVLAP